jgi:CelD/BcsL family acetyltransferase involved in cellulose biosynthesis
MPGFLAETAAGFAARGALALHLLRLGGRPIAGLLGFRERGTLYGYLQGSDPAYDPLSPGVLLLGAVVERSIEEGLAALDFLRGREPYKLWWGAEPRPTFRRRLSRDA